MYAMTHSTNPSLLRQCIQSEYFVNQLAMIFITANDRNYLIKQPDPKLSGRFGFVRLLLLRLSTNHVDPVSEP